MALYSCKSLSYTLLMFTFQEEEAKLLYGMIFSLKSFVNKLSPTDLKEGFLSYKVGRRLVMTLFMQFWNLDFLSGLFG